MVRGLIIVALCAGCTKNLCNDVRALGEPKILAIGDSVLAWNNDECQSIPDHVALASGAAVKNVSVNGARVLGGDAEKPAIVDQYVAGAWDWVIVDGGGNDLNGACPSDGCDAVQDALVSDDKGAIPDLIARIRADGARVMLLGYYPVHEGAWYGFDEIAAEIEEHDARFAKLARDGVTVFDLGELVTPASTPDAYDFDKVHPTPAAAKPLGARIAQLIKDAPALASP